MDKTIFGLVGGLVGVVLGFSLTFMKDWWFQQRVKKKEREFLAIRVSCILDTFVDRCADVAYDDGSFKGQYNKDGYAEIQTEEPTFEPGTIKVEWRSLPLNLLNEILTFPNEINEANQIIEHIVEFDGPPYYEDSFEERQFQYAKLGLKAARLASELRKLSNLPLRKVNRYDPVKSLNEKLTKIETLKWQRKKTHNELTQDNGGDPNDIV